MYVVSDNKLLVHEHTDFPEAGIQVPGGTIEVGETVAEAARRELLEESGISLTLDPIVLHREDYFVDRMQCVHRRTFVLFQIDVTTQPFAHTVSAGEEDEGLRFSYSWIDVELATELLEFGHDRGLSTLITALSIHPTMSPTVFHVGPFRFFFFSKEEMRMHVHILHPDGEAKFWIEPHVQLAHHSGLSSEQLNSIEKLVLSHTEEIANAWRTHFSG